VNTSVKYIMAIAAVVAYVVVPFSGYAAIGAEPSNKQPETTYYSSTGPMMGVPSYPGTYSGTGGEFVPSSPYSSVSPMMGVPSYPGTYSGTGGEFVPSSPMLMQPYSGMSPYLPYNEIPAYGTVPGVTYPSYPSAISPTYPGSYQSPWYQPTPGYPYPSQWQYGSVDQVYNQAMQAYRSGDYWTAMARFQDVATLYPQSDLADNAYYWVGEIYYAWKNFPVAIQSFQTVLYSYPNGNKVPDAYLKMGYAYAELRQYGIAKSILNDVAARYSTNTRIRNLAMKKLNELNNVY
jgi:tol-pal system protein YbgF